MKSKKAWPENSEQELVLSKAKAKQTHYILESRNNKYSKKLTGGADFMVRLSLTSSTRHTMGITVLWNELWNKVKNC